MAASASGYITDVAYVPGFYPTLAPLALRYVAALNGVTPPRGDAGFRVLELGCGLGRTLTTLAAANPGGEFVGVDLNPEHTAAIAHDVAAAGLGNVRVVTADFGHLPDDLGEFDFITAHGVYSWVGPEVRAEMVAIARERLAAGGLCLVSYNAMPGWAHLQPIRGILRQYAVLRQGDTVQRVRDGLAYLVYLRDKHAKYFVDNPGAAAYVEQLLRQDPRYLAHEFLHEHWTSFYFQEVARDFGAAGLAFVGSLPVHTNFWDLCVLPEFQELFRTTGDRLVTEAHKDFCANTQFRTDIYAKSAAPLGGLDGRLRAVDDIRFRVGRRGVTLPYHANLGVVSTTVQGPLYQSLVGLLSGGGLRLSEIVAADALRGTPPVEIARAVDAGVAMGLFEIAGHPLDESAFDAAMPRLPLAFNRAVLESDALGGRPVPLASPRTGTGHVLGDLEAAMLHEVCVRGREGLADRVATRLRGSGRMVERDGKPVTDTEEQRRLIAEACAMFVQSGLPELARLGIVTA